MRIFTIIAVTCALGTISGLAQTRSAVGVWDGSIDTPGAPLRVIVTLQQKDDRSWTGSIDIPMQGAKAVPLTKIAIDGASITFSISGPPGDPTFTGKLSEDGESISGDFSQGPAKFPFKIARNKTGRTIDPSLHKEGQLPYDERQVAYEDKSGNPIGGYYRQTQS